jgi:hypothetical protein
VKEYCRGIYDHGISPQNPAVRKWWPVSHASSRLVVVLSNYSEILDKSSSTKTDKKLINVYAYIL